MIHSSFKRWLRTPATLKNPVGVDAYRKTIFGEPESIMVFCVPLTSEQLSVLAIKDVATHTVISDRQISMRAYLEVEGVQGKTPKQVKEVKDHKGEFHHVEIIL